MELKSPRPKKNCKLKLSSPLPIIKTTGEDVYKFTGYFDGFSIVVQDPEEMQKLNKMGIFGKANLSKSFPVFNSNPEVAKIIRRRQYLRRKEWSKSSQNSVRKVIVVPDSDSEDDSYFTNLKAEYQIDASNIKETLNLSPLEAYFLHHDVNCLNVYYENELISEDGRLWQMLSDTDKFFVAKYITYRHFRAKNWVVKAGVKFGGDFLLYKDGPPFYHASYVVVIDVLDEHLQRREDMRMRSMKFVQLIGLNRLCETAGKELLICQLIWPRSCVVSSSRDACNVSVNEVIMRRWTPNQDLEAK